MAELETTSIRDAALDLRSSNSVSGKLCSWDNGLYGESLISSQEGVCHKSTATRPAAVNPMNRSAWRARPAGAVVSDRAPANAREPRAAVNPASKTATVGSARSKATRAATAPAAEPARPAPYKPEARCGHLVSGNPRTIPASRN